MKKSQNVFIGYHYKTIGDALKKCGALEEANKKEYIPLTTNSGYVVLSTDMLKKAGYEIIDQKP